MSTPEQMDSIGGSSIESSCDVCSKLMAAIASSDSDEKFELGTFDELLETNCAYHKPIIEFTACEWTRWENDDDAVIRVQSGEGASFYLEGPRGFLTFESTTSKDVPSPGPGRLLNKWIDSDLLRQWKRGCTCELESTVPELSHIRPRLLIDTQDMCLKWATQDDQYLALSYCWGKTPSFKTTNAIYDRLRMPGSLNDPGIPATIKHAMGLTAELEERFLWVDAICIIQDNEAFRDQEINNMAAIYSNANLTIIAAGGEDSSHGLVGLKVEGGFPRRPLRAYELPNSTSVVNHGVLHLTMTKWGSRGWTYQEKLFSAKTIVFKDDTVEWQCGCSLWKEYDCVDPWTIGAKSEPYLLDWYQKHKNMFNSVWPDFQEYQELVYYYSPSQLTIPEDIYDTFKGITSTLSKSFHGGFNFGLPVSYFDVALLWDFTIGFSRDVEVPPERRISSDPNKKLPSWSWMGWYGIIDTTPTQARVAPNIKYNYDNDPVKHTGLNRLLPIVKWYTITETGEHQTVQSSWDKFRHVGLSDSLEVPSGWTRHQNHPQEKTHYFVTTYAPGMEFQFPFPLIHDLLPLDQSPILSSLIGCHAQRTFLTIHPTEDQKHPTKLFNASTKIVGYIRRIRVVPEEISFVDDDSEDDSSDDNSSEDDFSDDDTELPTPPQIRVELVAISTGTCTWRDYLSYDRRSDWEEYEEIKENALNYYNVLSIWWEDGVAYRDGLGIVFKDEWEGAELEEIDLVLG